MSCYWNVVALGLLRHQKTLYHVGSPLSMEAGDRWQVKHGK